MRQRVFLTPMLLSCSDYDLIKRNIGDIFNQVSASKVDILLVVDNSCSMQPYQAELGANFDSFLTFFIEGDVDYQIGVTTTTITEPSPRPDDGCPESITSQIPTNGGLIDDVILTVDTPDPQSVFNDLVNVGVCGAGWEMGMESALQALENSNTPLLRNDAHLSIIFVSDEEDGSPMPVPDYVNRLRAIKDPFGRDVFNASSLVVPDIDACDENDIASGASPGTRYVEFAEEANGIVGDICGDDFSSIITDLSLASSRLNDTFFLTNKPDFATMKLTVEGEEMPCDGTGEYVWTYQLWENDIPVIIFDRTTLPPTNSRIAVEYNNGSGDPQYFCNDGESE